MSKLKKCILHILGEGWILKLKPSVRNLGFEGQGDDKPITLIVDDASGLTVSKKGDYIEEKWIREKKEFIKLQIL